MDEFTEQAADFLHQRVVQIQEEHENLTRAEKMAEMEMLNRIMYSLADDVSLTNDMCEALYLAGLKDGLRLLKLLAI